MGLTYLVVTTLQHCIRSWCKGQTARLGFVCQVSHSCVAHLTAALQVMCPTGKTPATSDCPYIPQSLFNRPSHQSGNGGRGPAPVQPPIRQSTAASQHCAQTSLLN